MDLQDVRYPVYIVSKGRYENPITAKMFMREGVNFKIVIEPQERDLYLKTIPEKNILCTNFSNLGLGSYPARNFAWQDSIKNGFDKHFLFDDNIHGFVSMAGLRRVGSATALESLNALIDFEKRFKKIAISGYNYSYFCTKENKYAFSYNTHVYSGMLINNHIPFRWRLKYNEDIDLCLQALHNGWNTILLNAYLINKVSTSKKLKGGNQTELYQNNAEEKKILKAKTIKEVWPQYVDLMIRFGRPHHFINWKKHFKQPLIKRPEYCNAKEA